MSKTGPAQDNFEYQTNVAFRLFYVSKLWPFDLLEPLCYLTTVLVKHFVLQYIRAGLQAEINVLGIYGVFKMTEVSASVCLFTSPSLIEIG